MPETLSADIRTGYDSQTAFDIKLDTFNRMNEVFNRPSKDFGIDYFDPLTRTSASQATTQQTTVAPPIKFSEAILSNDPKIRDLALDAVEKDAYSNPYARLNIGKEFRTPFNRGVDKFIDDKYGYDMFSDNEDFYYRNSYMDDGWFTRAMKNVLWRFPTRVIVGTATKFLEGVGYLGSMVTNGVVDGAKALAGKEVHYWQDVADNTLSKIMKNADDDFRDFVVPVYRQAGFDEKGFFSQLGNYAFWNDSFADGVAFLASAFIPAGIASKTGLLAKGVSLGAELGAEATSLAKVGGALRAGLRAATGAETYGEAGLSIFNTANEAAFQATAQYTETKQQLLDDRAQGKNTYTDRQIDEFSGKAAASSFGWNFPALMVSNAWEMKNIIKPIIGRKGNTAINTARTVLEDTGHVSFKEYANRLVKLGKFYGPKVVEGAGVEGWWEENIQNAIDRAGRGEYRRFGDDTDSAGVMEKAHGGFFGIIEQFAKQTIDTLKGNDRENSLSVGIGELLGVGGGSVGAKFGRRIIPGETKEVDGKIVPQTSFFLGERKQQQMATNLAISETNNLWNNFLSIQDVKNEDGTINEAKLATKVAAFESFAAKQEILNDLKEKKAFPEHELKALERRLMNDYVKGLVKVGQSENAVTRFQALANRNTEAKGEKLLSNPLEVSEYISRLGKLYEEEQSKPNQTSSKYSPAELQEINTAIKDRSFDLRAEREAIDPILKVYEKGVQDSLTKIMDFLQNDKVLPQGEFIEEGLARSRAKEYVEALAKKETYTDLYDQDSPQFLKEYHKAKIKEADDQIAALNKELGTNAPEIKDGNIKFNDKVINFRSKLLKTLLDLYKSAYSDKAQLEFMQQHNEHIADAITHPEKGLDNWNDYLDYVRRAIVKQNTPTKTETPPTEFKVGEKTYPDKAALDEALTNKEITQEQYDTAVKTATVTPPPVDTSTKTGGTTTTDVDTNDVTDDDTITGDGDGDKTGKRDTIDPDSALSWYTPLKSSTDDTVEINEAEEQLRDVPYDEVRKLVIRQIMADVKDFNEKYNLFMVNDTFPEIYRPPANNNNKEEVVPSGEVIIIEKKDGTRVTVKDFFGPKYKDLADLPIVFSAETEVFRNYLVAERAAIWAKKMQKSTKEAYDFYDAEHQRGMQARDLIKKDTSTKVSLQIIEATDGIMPVTKDVVPVTQRFGDNFTLSVRTQDTAEYSKGTILATFGKVYFPVGTMKLRQSATELANIQNILAKEFDDYESANQVRKQYLNTMFYTDKESQNFGIKQVGEKWKIYFRKLDEKDKNLPPDKKRLALKESSAYGELRFNMSREAMKNGMNIYNPATGVFTNITAEEYNDFIKTKVVTSLKKTLDKDGNLYMKPVNAYFSYAITDNRFKTEYTKKAQEANFDMISATIEQLYEKGDININTQRANLAEYLRKKAINKTQGSKIAKRLTDIEQEMATKAAQPAPKVEPKKAEPKKEEPKKAEEAKLPAPKTEEQEEDEEEKFKKLKAQERAKDKKKTDISEVVGNVEDKVETAYTVTVDNHKYTLNLNNGQISRPMILSSTTVKNFVITKSDKVYVKVLDEIAKAYPFKKADDGTISGILKVELEGDGQTFTAYGLPIKADNDVFVDGTNKVVRTKDVEGGELSPVPFLKTLLTEKGKAQLEDFLKRNC